MHCVLYITSPWCLCKTQLVHHICRTRCLKSCRVAGVAVGGSEDNISESCFYIYSQLNKLTGECPLSIYEDSPAQPITLLKPKNGCIYFLPNSASAVQYQGILRIVSAVCTVMCLAVVA